MQVGMGTILSSIDRDFNQGALSVTGRTFDLALSGRGFFAVEGADRTLYTRVGTFALDSNHDMVDLRTGNRVLGANGAPMSLDLDSIFAPKATAALSFSGNLPSEVTGPLAEQLASSSPLNSGVPAVQTATTGGPHSVPVGETWSFELVMNDGSPQNVSVTSVTGTITDQDVVDAVNTLDHVSAVLNGGMVELTSDVKGAKSSIKVTPGEAGKDLASMLGMSTSLVLGSETPAVGTTDLNALTSNSEGYQVGDTVEFSGTDADGAALAASFVYGVDGTTVDDLAAFLDGQYAGASVAYNPTAQQLELTSDGTGEAELSMVLLDGENQTGATDWTQHVMSLTINGTGPDTVTTSVEVFDAAGTGHQLSFTYERQADGSWNATVDLPPEDGTVINGQISGIQFNADGSILTPPSGQVQIQYAGQPAQTISLDFGGPGSFAGLTQFGGPSSVVIDDQDGYGAGELSSMQVNNDGSIEGYYNNGQTATLGQFGVATFANELGLEEVGDSLWGETPNTGARVFGGGSLGVAGEVVGGALEESNVDTAEQFVRLIQAQRGFQSNARVVTVQDEMMSEANNML